MKRKVFKKNKLAHIILIFTVLILAIYFLSLSISGSDKCTEKYQPDMKINANGLQLDTEVASTTPERTMGLSGKKCIDTSSAMLFVFDASDLHGFWMKDMKFSIDIIWLDQDKRVVDIKRDVSPATYPEVFYPTMIAKYVLETKPGLAESVDVKIGSQLSW